MTPRTPRLYDDLASWWPALSAPADYAEEAGLYRAALDAAAGAPVRTVLELGSGGGNNASHLRAHYALTLVDRSPGMLAVSRALNPGVEHREGDMRTVRLGRLFDAVLIHDAIAYMTTRDDLRAAVATAYAHCRPGGVALFVPDDTLETWRPTTTHGGHDLGERALRYLEWTYDPDPTDTQVTSVFALLLREGDDLPRCERDVHVCGLFPRAVWLSVLEEVGFRPRALPYEHSEFEAGARREMFLGVRPA